MDKPDSMKRTSDSPVILAYHRIGNAYPDNGYTAVSEHNFKRHLKILAEHKQVVPLYDLVAALNNKKLIPNAVAITFDDGYGDFALSALPLLEKYNMPATLFVTAGLIDSGRGFWQDILEDVFLSPRPLPGVLNVPGIPGSFMLDTAGSRLHVHDELGALLKQSNYSDIQTIITEILIQAGLPPDHPSPYPVITGAQVKKAASAKNIEIGSHCLTHANLNYLGPRQLDREMGESKAILESLCLRPVRLVAYPYGGKGDFNASAMRAAKKAGYFSGLSVSYEAIHETVDLFAVPRRIVRNLEGDQFLYWLTGDNAHIFDLMVIGKRMARMTDYLRKINPE